MKDIKIKINKLGAIRDSEITMAPLLVISGESNLGKSYLATLIHYMYRQLLEWKFRDFFSQKGWSYEILAQNNKEEGKISFSTSELIEWLNEDACKYMRKALGNPGMEMDIMFEIPLKQDTYNMTYKTELMGISGKEELYLIFEIEDFKNAYRIPANSKDISILPWYELFGLEIKTELLGDDYLEETFTMPPGRGVLLNVGSALQDSLRGESAIIKEFLDDWDIVKRMDPKEQVDPNLYQFLTDIIEGKIVIDGTRGLLYQMQNGSNQPIPINAAASSIKELAPLSMLVEKCPIESLSILFEESEAHLHPSKQLKIADFIALAASKGAHMQITTHSDYVIRRINDRIMLHFLKNHLSETEYSKLLKESKFNDLTLDPALVGAYLLRKKNGTSDSVEVVHQSSSSEGISYESFYSVLENDVQNSYIIKRFFDDARQNC